MKCFLRFSDISLLYQTIMSFFYIKVIAASCLSSAFVIACTELELYPGSDVEHLTRFVARIRTDIGRRRQQHDKLNPAHLSWI